MPISTLPATVNVRRLQSRRGRPRNDERTNTQTEYTRGSSSSSLAYVSTPGDLERLHGTVDDIDLVLGWDEKEAMDNDPHCAAALDTLALGATVRPVEVEPAKSALFTSDEDEQMSIEIAEFIRRCLVYLAGSHRDMRLIAFQLIREALKIGHSKAEIVMRLMEGGPDDMKMVPDRIKSKNRHNSCFVVDRQGNTVGIAAYVGDYGKYSDPYARMGLTGYMSAGLLGPGWKLLEKSKWLVMTNRPPSDDSALGRSVLRPAYTPYRCKRDVLPMYLRCLDNTASPQKIGELPEHQYSQDTYPLDSNGAPDRTQAKVPLARVMHDAIQKGSHAGITIVPHTGKVYQLNSTQSGDPFVSASNHFNNEITRSILLQTLATGTDQHMARAAGQVHQDILQEAVRHVRAMGADAITRCCFTYWVRLNYPSRFWHLVPTCSFGEVELNDFAAWAGAFRMLSDGGLLLPSQFAHIWAVLGLPQGDMQELLADLEEDAALNEQLLQPEVSASGKVGPSQLKKYSLQELGKVYTRKAGARRARRQGVLSAI